MYEGKQREIVRDNYNAVAKRVAEELFLLHPDWAFDPVQLAHHTNALIDELKAQRNTALTTLSEQERERLAAHVQSDDAPPAEGKG